MEDDLMVIMLNALGGQGKSEKVLEYRMARTVIDIRPVEG